MPENRLLRSIEWVVNTWVENTPNFLQPYVGWIIYWSIADRLS